MCKKKQFRYCPSEIDECMKDFIMFLEDNGIKPIACCCGHQKELKGKYPLTIIIRNHDGYGFDIVNWVAIPRKRNFYKRDKEGYYFIPEVI